MKWTQPDWLIPSDFSRVHSRQILWLSPWRLFELNCAKFIRYVEVFANIEIILKGHLPKGELKRLEPNWSVISGLLLYYNLMTQLSGILCRYTFHRVTTLIEEIERNTKFNVRQKLCHIWPNSQAFEAVLLRQAIKCRHFIAWRSWVKYDIILVGR